MLLSASPAHLHGFEEDSRSEVVFWIDELSVEIWLSLVDVAHVLQHTPLSFPLRSY